MFLPAQLIRLQQELVYRRNNWSILTSDEPATVRLGNEVLQLRPLDRTKDEPNTRSSFNKVLALMEESGDWGNLPGFLEGLKTAGRKFEPGVFEKLVRKAVEAGKTGLVIECLKRVEATGLGLWDLGVAREVIWGATALALRGEWSKAAVEQGVRYAENVWNLMCDPKHGGVQKDHPKTRPEILGVLVQMHAVKAVLSGEGRDEAGIVQKYAQMMLRHWHQAELGLEEGNWVDANHKMVIWAPVLHGIKRARKVVGEQSALGILLGEKVDRELEPLLQKAQSSLRDAAPKAGKRRGLIISEELSRLPS